MFCTECGKQLREGAFFCPYCGVKQHVSIPAIKNTPDGTSASPTTKLTRLGSFVVPMLLISAIALILYFVSTAYDCDVCGSSQIGASYYDIGGSGKMCKECAEDYWAPFPIKDYKN